MKWIFGGGALAMVPLRFVLSAVGEGGGDPVGVSTLVVQLGLSGVFLWQFLTERNQRIKRDDQVVSILERQGPVLIQAIEVLKAVQDSQRSVAVRSATDWDEIAGELRKVSEALNAEAGKRRRPDRG